MSGLITRKQGEAPVDRPTPKSLHVAGLRYANAAAKFWPSLIDEVAEDFLDCTAIELAAPSGSPLERSLLFPVLNLDDEIRALRGRSVRQAMKETLAELELLGPPAPVQVRLLKGETEILSAELPLDCIDSETFPYLLVWPLEWAGLPHVIWNNETLDGRFTGEDRRRGITYGIAFSLTNTHRKEGLYRRTLSVAHTVSMLA
jgi:hypothetical protein